MPGCSSSSYIQCWIGKSGLVAMDWHDIMFYGDANAEGVKGTKHKNGTNWAYQFATAAVVMGDEKLTVAGK